MVRRIAAMLDQDPDGWAEGDPLPRGWHFFLLGADTRRSDLREDGFPGLGVRFPALDLPRLVLGSRTVRYHADLYVGAALRRESRVESITEKQTAHGPMAIVVVRHVLHAAQVLVPIIEETHTYLMLSARYSHPTSELAGPAGAHFPPATKRVVPDEILLFQYSALGFNSHRVHLDRRFAQESEGLPDLVVNGGLATLLLTEFLRIDLGGTFSAISARHLAPLFCGRPLTLGAERRDDTWRLRAWDDAGRVAVEIEATI